MQRTKWIARKFNFDFPEGWIFNIIERLEGTECRIRELLKSHPSPETIVIPGKWTIKEHIGHLSDLEDLHEGRIDDLLNRKSVLRAADMTNAQTYSANHNQKDIAYLLTEFKNKRTAFILRLRQLDEETMLFKSLHPRLNVDMRAVDVAYFTAEHDDHHLTSMRELIRLTKDKH